MVAKRQLSSRNDSNDCNQLSDEHDEQKSVIDWFFWRVCVGISGVSPPLCSWKELNDGTYSIADVYLMNTALDEILEQNQQMLIHGG